MNILLNVFHFACLSNLFKRVHGVFTWKISKEIEGKLVNRRLFSLFKSLLFWGVQGARCCLHAAFAQQCWCLSSRQQVSGIAPSCSIVREASYRSVHATGWLERGKETQKIHHRFLIVKNFDIICGF